MRVNHRESELENHDRGLDYDLPRLLERRGLLKLVAGAGLAGAGMITLGACAADTATPAATPGSDGAPSGAPSGGPGGGPPGGGAPPESGETSDTANGELPEETAGPYGPAGSSGSSPFAVSLVSPLSGGARGQAVRHRTTARGPTGRTSEPAVAAGRVRRAGAEGDQAGPGETGPGHELQQAPAFSSRGRS